MNTLEAAQEAAAIVERSKKQYHSMLAQAFPPGTFVTFPRGRGLWRGYVEKWSGERVRLNLASGKTAWVYGSDLLGCKSRDLP